jgi:hypothetical protein
VEGVGRGLTRVTFVWRNCNYRNTFRSQYHLASCSVGCFTLKITSCIFFCLNDSLCFMAAKKPSVIYQTKCTLCRFVTFYTTHVVVFSSLSSLFFFWNCEMYLLPFLACFEQFMQNSWISVLHEACQTSFIGLL